MQEMQMLITRLFQGQEYKMEMLNGQPIIDIGVQFFYDDCGTETDFDFPDYSSSYFKIYNERSGRLLKTIPLTKSGNILMINSADTDLDDLGNYWYEVVYIMAGGYEQILRFGNLEVI